MADGRGQGDLRCIDVRRGDFARMHSEASGDCAVGVEQRADLRSTACLKDQSSPHSATRTTV
jgi:hypothetical protein